MPGCPSLVSVVCQCGWGQGRLGFILESNTRAALGERCLLPFLPGFRASVSPGCNH